MSDRVKMHLEGVEETLLIPLWARAAETRRADALIRDERAVELVDQIDYDFSKLSWDWSTQVGVAIRTEILDDATRAFLSKHPDALIINIAAGLDTRFYRLDNGQLTWVDVDLPNSMALRRTFFNDTERHLYVTGSVLEDAWCAEVPKGRPTLVIIEGLCMYLAPEETQGLLDRIARFFPGAEVLMECVSPFLADKSAPYFWVRGMAARFRGGLEDGRDVEAWGHTFVQQWHYFDRHPARWGALAIGKWIPVWRNTFKIVHLSVRG